VLAWLNRAAIGHRVGGPVGDRIAGQSTERGSQSDVAGVTPVADFFPDEGATVGLSAGCPAMRSPIGPPTR
ncbi:MAG TPA: hypothetical protein VIV65_11215, partial [Gemmatimonadaceae bacterium]